MEKNRKEKRMKLSARVNSKRNRALEASEIGNIAESFWKIFTYNPN